MALHRHNEGVGVTSWAAGDFGFLLRARDSLGCPEPLQKVF